MENKNLCLEDDMEINPLSSDDILSFAEDSPLGGSKPTGYYKLLIADDDDEVHAMTRLVLSDYEYDGAGIQFLSAFSGEEAKEIIRENPDIACILLDVVMESDDAGLEVVRFIRKEAGNRKIRIILRTGQPGKAPEKDIILNYDINDYKEKTELTSQKLFTTITTAFRSYRHLNELEQKKQEINDKNHRLNEEIARRIVAETNLTKYNRSLEKMSQVKSDRLEKALNALKAVKLELREARKSLMIAGISSACINDLDDSVKQIRLNLNAMEEGCRDRVDDLAHDIDKISGRICDMRWFIESIREPFTHTDLNQIIGQAADEVCRGFDQNMDIQLDLGQIPKISVPEKNFKTALAAVIRNGFEAADHDGTISISTQIRDKGILIRISDAGCGIDPNDLPHVFDPYTTGSPGNKKGLGLSFVKQVLLHCGGDIHIQSAPRKGTLVTLTLPWQDGLEPPG